MNKTLQTFRYLSKSFMGLTFMGFLVILGNVAIVDLVFFLTNRYNPVQQVVPLTGPFEVTDGIVIFLVSLIPFIPNLKIAVANGVSRKTFLLANLPVAAIMAGALSIFNLAVVRVHDLFWPIIFLSDLFYPQNSWAGVLVLQFALYFLLIAAGWCVTLAYYRSRVPLKWVISLAPLGLYALLRVANALSGGDTFQSIGAYLRFSLGSPLRATLSMLAYAVVLCGVVYLLIRRAPVPD